jgi:hypothetical protein
MYLYSYIDSSVKEGWPPCRLSERTRRQESAFAVLGSPKDTLFIIADNPDIFDILRELVMQYVLIKEYR